jgi:hypothetical protein
VFDSELATVGLELFERLEGKDWRVPHEKSVEDVLTDDDMEVWSPTSMAELSASRRPNCIREVERGNDRDMGLPPSGRDGTDTP